MKLRTAAVSLALLAATITPLACAPAPSYGCTHHYFSPGANVLDLAGDTVARLVVHEDVCISDNGVIQSATASQEGYNVGWTSVFSGGTLEELPRGVDQPPAYWTNPRYVTGHWHLQLAYTLWGYGFHVSKGDCTVTGAMGSFGGNIQERNVYAWCSGLNANPIWG